MNLRQLIVASGCWLILLVVNASAQRGATFDPEEFMTYGDADLDRRLSFDEFKDFMGSSPRFRDTESLKRFFERLDRDGDGYLSAAEYVDSMTRFQRRPTGRRGGFGQAREESSLELTPEQTEYFEKNVRPVLVKHCYECHSSEADDLQGGLRLDTFAGLRQGGDLGPAIVPESPDESLLIQSIRYGEELQMPPDGKLSDEAIAMLERWVAMGAPDPRFDAEDSNEEDHQWLKGSQDFWAFQAPVRSQPPAVVKDQWPQDNLDRFVLAKLEAKGLAPVRDADRTRLLRRLSFDLTGLPPTVKELEDYLADESSTALETVVDRLLASPRFGERWGRHWLDVARYAESSGETNFTYPQAWRYRDWVIESFNNDKPYDQFVSEQIAGDLLTSDNDTQRARQLIATGFLAIGSKSHDDENRAQFQLDVIDEQIEATTRAFLGLTVACARCHDHKLDPISQRDYYALAGIFRSTRTCSGTLSGVFPNFNPSPLIELPAEAEVDDAVSPLSPERKRQMEQRLQSYVEQLNAVPNGESNRDQRRRLNSMLSMLRHRLLMDRDEGAPRAFAMGVVDRVQPKDSPLYIRGELEQPGAIVPRGFISIIANDATPEIESGSGRLELSHWLASAENPLTARVMVNRVWLHLFGRGLVTTPDNFGAAGSRPSHPELLDNLACDFVEDGWSIKRLIRRIVLSRTYGLDSTFDQANYDVDPDNELIWRMSKRRLEGEVIRDSLLFVSGQLDLEKPAGTSVTQVGEGLARFVRLNAVDVIDRHRSVYLPVVRDSVPDSLTLFDFADPSLVTGQRNITTGPTQALFFMNGSLVRQQANHFARKLIESHDDASERIRSAYIQALGRTPSDAELARASKFIEAFRSIEEVATSERDAWAALSQALFACTEFRYVD